MNKHEKALLLEMMREYGSILGGQSCNDWHWPKSWGWRPRADFLRGMEVSGIPDIAELATSVSTTGEYGPPNFVVWAYLAHLVEHELED